MNALPFKGELVFFHYSFLITLSNTDSNKKQSIELLRRQNRIHCAYNSSSTCNARCPAWHDSSFDNGKKGNYHSFPIINHLFHRIRDRICFLQSDSLPLSAITTTSMTAALLSRFIYIWHARQQTWSEKLDRIKRKCYTMRSDAEEYAPGGTRFIG